MECNNLFFINIAIQKAKTNFHVKQYLDSYKKICADFGIPDIHNPYNYSHKYVNNEHLITDAIKMLKESLNYI